METGPKARGGPDRRRSKEGTALVSWKLRERGLGRRRGKSREVGGGSLLGFTPEIFRSVVLNSEYGVRASDLCFQPLGARDWTWIERQGLLIGAGAASG